VVAALHEQVTTGVPLHQAMEAQPRVFPSQTVALVHAGEISGKLPEAFESLSAHYQWLDQLVSDIRQALIYPVMVLGASLLLVVGLFTFVVPRFVELLVGLSLQIPLLTRLVISASNVLLRGWPVLLALALGLPAGLKLALRSPAFACGFDRALLRLPVFGPLIAMFALSRFTNNLGLLYGAGIPLLRGLAICRDLVGNRAVAQALDEVRQGVAEGAPLSRCLGRYDFFPATLVTMIASGETSGRLDFSLRSVSDYYNTIIPRRIKMIFAILDPVVMVSLISVVGCVALAVILPILQLWQAR
jgi:type IV pilus assembly protein PilC